MRRKCAEPAGVTPGLLQGGAQAPASAAHPPSGRSIGITARPAQEGDVARGAHGPSKTYITVSALTVVPIFSQASPSEDDWLWDNWRSTFLLTIQPWRQ